MTFLAGIYGVPVFLGSGPGFVNRTQSDPGFVNPVRSGHGFVTDPIPSHVVRVVNAYKIKKSVSAIVYT